MFKNVYSPIYIYIVYIIILLYFYKIDINICGYSVANSSGDIQRKYYIVYKIYIIYVVKIASW